MYAAAQVIAARDASTPDLSNQHSSQPSTSGGAAARPPTTSDAYVPPGPTSWQPGMPHTTLTASASKHTGTDSATGEPLPPGVGPAARAVPPTAAAATATADVTVAGTVAPGTKLGPPPSALLLSPQPSGLLQPTPSVAPMSSAYVAKTLSLRTTAISLSDVLDHSASSVRKTKVVCTLGPSCWSEEGMAKLLDAGMDVARFNFSHGTHEAHQEVLDRLRKVRRVLVRWWSASRFPAFDRDLLGMPVAGCCHVVSLRH